MKRNFFLSLPLLLIILSGFLPVQEKSGIVVAVFDGDTIEILDANKQTLRIRFNGIDAPEKAQAFGNAAKQYLSDLCYKKQVRVVIRDVDRYGRSIGDVYLNGTHLNREMVRAGLAWHYKQYSKDEELARLENEARLNKVGLWRESDPMPPWNFRRLK